MVETDFWNFPAITDPDGLTSERLVLSDASLRSGYT